MSESPLSRESAPAAPADPASRNGPRSLSERVRSLRLPERQSAPASWRTWVPWLLVLGLAASVVYLSLREAPAPSPEQAAPSPGGSPGGQAGSRADSSNLPPAAGEVALESKGYIIPVHQIQVSPKVSGMVIELNIKEGKLVQKGDVLARLEQVEYQADHNRARALAGAAWHRWVELASGYRAEEKAQAKAELDEMKAQRDQLYQEWRRNQSLRGGPALTPRDYEQAESAYLAMAARVERLRHAYDLMIKGQRQEKVDAAWADVEQAEADVAKARWRLDNCTILAPITGTILTKKAEEGNIVNSSAFNISATLCDLADLSDLEVDLAIPDRDISKIFPGQKSVVRPEAYLKRTYEGTVSRIMPIADRSKGAVPVRVKIHIPPKEIDDYVRGVAGPYLRPDMGAIVTFYNERSEQRAQAATLWPPWQARSRDQ